MKWTEKKWIERTKKRAANNKAETFFESKLPKRKVFPHSKNNQSNVNLKPKIWKAPQNRYFVRVIFSILILLAVLHSSTNWTLHSTLLLMFTDCQFHSIAYLSMCYRLVNSLYSRQTIVFFCSSFHVVPNDSNKNILRWINIKREEQIVVALYEAGCRINIGYLGELFQPQYSKKNGIWSLDIGFF